VSLSMQRCRASSGFPGRLEYLSHWGASAAYAGSSDHRQGAPRFRLLLPEKIPYTIEH
jgi:hypothetical protein